MVKKKYITKREKWGNGYWFVLRDDEGKRVKWKKWHSNKAKRSINLNFIQTFIKRDFWKKQKKGKKGKVSKEKQRTLTPIQKLALIQEQARGFPKAEDLEKKIERKGIKKIKELQIRTRGVIDNSRAVKEYRKLLKGRVKDKEEMRNIIVHRNKTLKHRLTCHITIFTDKGVIGTILIGGVLLEKDVDAHNFWNDRYIESDMFQKYCEEFRTMLDNPKIYKYHSSYIKAGTVIDTKTEWSFA